MNPTPTSSIVVPKDKEEAKWEDAILDKREEDKCYYNIDLG